MNLLTPAERAWLFTLAVTLAVIGWGGLAYWLIMVTCCQYRPWLFAAFWGAIMGEIVAVLLLLLERKRSLDDLERQALRTEEARNKFPWMYQGDLNPMPRISTWEATSPTSWAKLDLARACGDVYAADEFTRLVKQNHRLQVEYWKTVRKVGRVKFEHMRAALEAVGYVDRGGAKGSYRWTEDGERWLNGL